MLPCLAISMGGLVSGQLSIAMEENVSSADTRTPRSINGLIGNRSDI